MIGQIWMRLNASEVHWPAAIAYGKQKRMVQKRSGGRVRRHVSSFSLPCPRIVSPVAMVSQIPDHYARGQPSTVARSRARRNPKPKRVALRIAGSQSHALFDRIAPGEETRRRPRPTSPRRTGGSRRSSPSDALLRAGSALSQMCCRQLGRRPLSRP